MVGLAALDPAHLRRVRTHAMAAPDGRPLEANTPWPWTTSLTALAADLQGVGRGRRCPSRWSADRRWPSGSPAASRRPSAPPRTWTSCCGAKTSQGRAAALAAGMDYFEVMGVGMFLDREDPNRDMRSVSSGPAAASGRNMNCPRRHRGASRAIGRAARGLACRLGADEALGQPRPGPRAPPRPDRRGAGRPRIVTGLPAGVGRAAGGFSSARRDGRTCLIIVRLWKTVVS